MFLQILAGLGCLLAALMQFATHRSPDIVDPPQIKHARMLTVAAMLIAAFALFGEAHAGREQALLGLVCGLFALGQILFGLDSLMEESWWKSLSNNSR